MKLKLREKCLSTIILCAITEHVSAQQNQFNDTSKYLVSKKIFEFKNQRWDFNGCRLKIITETKDTITLKPYNSNHSDEEIEVKVVVELDGKDIGNLYIIIEGEKHFVNLTSVYHFGSKGLALRTDNVVYNSYKMDHYSHCSHYSRNR